MKDDLSIQVLSKIPTGYHPSGITIGIAKDNRTKMVYVANTDSNWVSGNRWNYKYGKKNHPSRIKTYRNLDY